MRLPKHVHAFIDRHGHARHYYRAPGMPRATLPGLPWSPEFMAALEVARRGEPLRPEKRGAGVGTVDALIIGWYRSAGFLGLADSTRATYRGWAERFREQHGGKRVATLSRKHVQDMMDARAATPAAANNRLRLLRMLMALAVEIGMRSDDPTHGVKPLRVGGQGFHTWTEEEIAAFEVHHPIGSRARLAMALLLYTGQRRSDVVNMGRQHVRDGHIRVRQQKTGTELWIPIHDELATILKSVPPTQLTFIVTDYGKPYTAKGFGNWFRDQCRAAGVPGRAHGLRKAIARRLAEAGCSANEIMAVTGHKTLKEVARYTAAADQKVRADNAMAKITTRTPIGNPADRVAKRGG